MRINILPKTPLGRWSVGLTAAFILLDVLRQIFYAYLHRDPIPNPPPPSPFVFMAVGVHHISGIAAFVTGLISIIKSKERSILVFLVVAVGFLALLFLLGEVIFPH